METLVLVIIISAVIISINERIRKSKNDKIEDSIKNKLNKPTASTKEIRKAYEYETGKNPIYTTKKSGTALEYEAFKILYKNRGKVLANLYIEKAINRTTEIDIIFIHKTGIYVVECKDINAYVVLGRENQNSWTCMYTKQYKKSIYNPLKQNIGHINTLKKILSIYPSSYYNSLVVMNAKKISCDYTSNSSNYNQKIVNIHQLRNYIDRLIDKKEEVLSEEEILKIHKTLHNKYSNATTIVKKTHRENIKKMLNNK